MASPFFGIICDMIRRDEVNFLPQVAVNLGLWRQPYEPKTGLEKVLYNARCCKELGQQFNDWGNHAVSFRMLKVAVKRFVRRYSHFPESIVGCKMSALCEAITVAVNIDSTGDLPSIPARQRLEMFYAILRQVPNVLCQSEKLKVMEFVFLQSKIPNSGVLSKFKIPASSSVMTLSWFIKHGIISASLYQQVLHNGWKPHASELVRAFKVLDDKSGAVILKSFEDQKIFEKLCNLLLINALRINELKPKCAGVLISAVKSDRDVSLKKVFIQFNQTQLVAFADECNAFTRGDFLKVALYSDPNQKKYPAIVTVLASGPVWMNNLELCEMFRVPSCLQFLLLNLEMLQRFFDNGLKICCHEEELVVLLLRHIEKNPAGVNGVVDTICILLEQSTGTQFIHGLRHVYTYSKNFRTPVLGATELAVKVDDPKILRIVLQRLGRRVEDCDILITTFKQNHGSKQIRKWQSSRFQTKMNSDTVRQQQFQSTSHSGDIRKSEISVTKDDHVIQCTQETDNDCTKELESIVFSLLQKDADYFHIDQTGNQEHEAKTAKASNASDDESEEDESQNTNQVGVPSATHSQLESTASNFETDVPLEDFSALPWPILISKQAADLLKAKKTSKRVVKDIKAKLYALGQGYRGDALCHKCIQPEDNLYETYLYRESRIIWQETIQYSEQLSTSEGGKIYTDVIRVLWIATRHTKNQLNDVLQRIKAALKKSRTSNSKKLHQCPSIAEITNSKFKNPRQFTEHPSRHKLTGDEYRPLPNLFGGEYSLMQFHPFHEFLDAYLNNDTSNYDTAICMSPQEHDIIRFPYKKKPIVLCGRSGTGKTTTCIYRMWNEYKTFWEKFHYYHDKSQIETDGDNGEDDDATQSLRQVFVTKSPVLCSQVRKHFGKLVNGNSRLKRIWTNATSMEHKSLMDFRHEDFPLFRTSRHFLLILDYSLPGKPFFPRDEGGNLAIHLLNSDYNQDTNPDDLLFGDDFEDNHSGDGQGCKEQWKEVTADYFCENIWPKMKSRKKFDDPLLVWMEIQSFIKGSVCALMSADGCLSKDQYINSIGKKMAPSYDCTEREAIYDCFLEYQSILHNGTHAKNCTRMFDECDVICNLFKRFDSHHPSWHIDHFYIDEVQDFTQGELSLLLRCSSHPSGTFCTGDTAQSIMKGVFFRFEDLKSQFWQIAQRRDSELEVPKLHQLTENFRAHSGILKLAQGIIRLMKDNFKKSFQDAILPSEVAMFDGPDPILLDAESTEELTSILLGNRENNTMGKHELGAHQAILVRTDEARQNLPESLKHGLVLTILEAKGLEFNDVLLYDFFTDSKVIKEWHLFYNACDGPDTDEVASLLNVTINPLRPSAINEKDLKSLLAELKYLYTAITRAKVNLWVYDSSAKKRGPAFLFWLVKKLAKFVKTNAIDVDSSLLFAAPSENEQWAKQGDHYFRIQKWKLALTCYERAKLSHQLQVTKAYMMVEEATKQPTNCLVYYQRAALAFLVADSLLHSSEFITKAIQCLKRSGLHEMAAKLLEKMGQIELAEREWAKTNKKRDHARVLEMLEEYSRTVKAYVADGDYIMALKKAVQFESKGVKLKPMATAQQIASEYANLKVKEGDKESVHHIMAYISDGAIKADFLKETGLYLEAVKELLKERHHSEAFRVLKAQNMFEEGIEYAKDPSIKDGFRLCLVRRQMFHGTCNDALINVLCNSKDMYIKAHAEFLYAVFTNDVSFFRRAMRSFTVLKSIPGILMVHEARLAQNVGSKLDMVEMLTMSRQASQASKAVSAFMDGKAASKQRQLTRAVLRLYDIEEEDQSHYSISENSFQNTKHTTLNLKEACVRRDIDGMLILRKRKVHQAILAMYNQMCFTWLNIPDVQHYYKNLLLKLYTIYNDGQLKNNLQRFFDEAMNVLEFHALLPENDLPILQLETVEKATVSVFSFAMRSIHQVRVSNDVFVTEYFQNAAYKLTSHCDENLDDYFLAWILHMFFSPSIEKFRKIVVEKANEDSHLVLQYRRKTHIFFWWMHAVKQILYHGNLKGACCTVIFHILSRLHEIDHPQIISIPTVTYIASLMTTLLAIVFNTSFFVPVNFIVPMYYENIYGSFISIFDSPVTLTDYSTSSVDGVVTHLLSILDFVLGYKQSLYSTLRNSLSSESSLKDGSAQNCLILCLVLITNLYHYSNTIENIGDMHSRLLFIQKELQCCRKCHGNVNFVDEAYYSLQSAKELSDVVHLIMRLSSEDIMVQPCGNDSLCSAVFKEVSPFYMAHYCVQIKRLVIIQDSEEELASDDKSLSVQAPAVASGADDTKDNQLPNEEIDDDFVDDETGNEEGSLDIENDQLLEDDECLACGIIAESVSGMTKHENQKSHLETFKHSQKAQRYRQWKAVMEETKTLNDELMQVLAENGSLVCNRTLENTSRRAYKKMVEKMEAYQKSFAWVKCIDILQEYQQKAKQWLKEVYSEKFTTQQHDQEKAEPSIDLLPPQEKMIWSKK